MSDHNVNIIVRHHDFDKHLLTNDICLISTTNNFEDQFIKRIPIAGPRYKYTAGDICTVYGFGVTDTMGNMERSTEKLRKVHVKIIDIKKCIDAYQSRKTSQYNAYVSKETSLCAGWPEGGKDACKFDSGGPLVGNLNATTSVLIGIVSFGYDCGNANFPGVYTKVNQYVNWMLDFEKTRNIGTGAVFVNN
ncbi:hypothetical protein ILUMI_10380 [Ignelater luminosus]|uniref:Peptidase S1 domain-containing protein n=1 Tax=Ignelater luminosus TaxID=2038154 RepID=A0A8K0D785_IGNLU|nr:hypothetical protein ILUMI_10380 [Ignelater luminosus]